MSDVLPGWEEVKAIGCFAATVLLAAVATLLVVVFLVGRWTA